MAPILVMVSVSRDFGGECDGVRAPHVVFQQRYRRESVSIEVGSRKPGEDNDGQH